MPDMEQTAATLLYRRGMAHLESQSSPLRLGIINALAHPALRALAALTSDIRLQQTNRNKWLTLEAQGLKADTALDDSFDCILLMPSRHRIQTLGWMASAMRQLSPGGILICCCPNMMGARSYEKHLHELGGNIRSASKSRCRIFSCQRTEKWNAALADAWEAEAAPRKLPGTGLYTRAGLFSWKRPDTGSSLLLDHLPADLAGTGMDLCCGYGLLAAGLLTRCHHIDTLHLVDTEQLALACASLNLAQHHYARLMYHWLDATHEPLPDRLDWVVLNPPFHNGHEQDVTLGQRIITAACHALKPGGRLFLVANRKLPYEAVLKTGLKRYRPLHEGAGYKVICGER